jgi:peroxiredoxin Q/BCP
MKRSLFLHSIVAGALVLASLVGNSHAAEPLKVGAVAPDFELKGSDGKTYKLSDFKGKEAVVVAWYPKAFTGG